jgi:3-dehydroquinate synthetase
MLAAAHVSHSLGYLDRADQRAHLELLRLNGAPTNLPDGLDVDAIVDVCRRDNKRGYVASRVGELDLVLLQALGCPVRTGN